MLGRCGLGEKKMTMISKILDWVFPVGGAAGAPLAVYIFDAQHHIVVAVDAAIIAVVGGIVGWTVKKVADWLLESWKCRKDKKKNDDDDMPTTEELKGRYGYF